MEPVLFKIDERYILEHPEQYFQDVMPSIPTCTIIHKTITGIGATTCELEDRRHSIIVLPNIATIESKHLKYTGSFPVYELTSPSKLAEYIQEYNGFQKLLTTPESLRHIVNTCLKHNIDPFEKYFVLLDEFHKYVEDVGYRPFIVDTMNYFFKFNGKAMISATPLPLRDPRFQQYKFTSIKVEPGFQFAKPIELLFHNNHIEALKTIFERNPTVKQCIFFNSINGITDIIKKLGRDFEDMSANSSIFCSKESAKHLNNLLVDGRKPYTAYSTFDPESMSQFNFFTSSFYNGLDIELDELPQVILLTVRNDPKTYFDPFTDSIQVVGRFRKKDGTDATYKDEVVHLIDGKYNRPYKTQEQVSEWFAAERNVYDTIYTLYRANPNYSERTIYQESLKRLRFHKFLIDERHLKYTPGLPDYKSEGSTPYELNHFKIDHYYHEQRLYSYYADFENLWRAYQEAGFDSEAKADYRAFTVYLNAGQYHNINGEELLQKLNMRGGKRYSKENVAHIINFLLAAENISGNHADYNRVVEPYVSNYPLVVKAYDKIGWENVQLMNFDIVKIRQALIDYDVKAGKNKEPVIDSVYHKFSLNVPLTLDSIKKGLQSIYEHYKLPAKAKATDLKQWFELRECKIVRYVAEPANPNTQERLSKKQKAIQPKKRVEHRAYVLLKQKYNLHRLLERT